MIFRGTHLYALERNRSLICSSSADITESSISRMKMMAVGAEVLWAGLGRGVRSAHPLPGGRDSGDEIWGGGLHITCEIGHLH